MRKRSVRRVILLCILAVFLLLILLILNSPSPSTTTHHYVDVYSVSSNHTTLYLVKEGSTYYRFEACIKSAPGNKITFPPYTLCMYKPPLTFKDSNSRPSYYGKLDLATGRLYRCFNKDNSTINCNYRETVPDSTLSQIITILQTS